MKKEKIEEFKKKLLAEKKQLEEQLERVGTKSTPNTTGWEATSENIEVDTADVNELADKLEEYEGNTGILTSLETQLNEVAEALDRIDKGTFGLCEKCGKPIEIDRLEANPSSKISLKHNH